MTELDEITLHKLEKADDLRLNGQYWDAITEYLNIRHKIECNAEAKLDYHIKLGLAYFAVNRFEDAETQAGEALAISSSNEEALQLKDKCSQYTTETGSTCTQQPRKISSNSRQEPHPGDKWRPYPLVEPTTEWEGLTGKELWQRSRAEWLGVDLSVVQVEKPFDSMEESAVQKVLNSTRSARKSTPPRERPNTPSGLLFPFNLTLPTMGSLGTFNLFGSRDENADLIHSIESETRPYPTFKRRNLSDAVSICAKYWALDETRNMYN